MTLAAALGPGELSHVLHSFDDPGAPSRGRQICSRIVLRITSHFKAFSPAQVCIRAFSVLQVARRSL